MLAKDDSSNPPLPITIKAEEGEQCVVLPVYIWETIASFIPSLERLCSLSQVSKLLHSAVQKYIDDRVPNVKVTIFAGRRKAGFQSGQGTHALLAQPTGVAIDSFGTVFVADQLNNCVRKIDKEGNVTVFGDARYRRLILHKPVSVAVNNTQNILYIREFLKTTAANSKGVVACQLPQSASRFVCDREGAIYALMNRKCIKKFSLRGEITTFAPGMTGAPKQMAVWKSEDINNDDEAIIYVTDPINHVIWKFTKDRRTRFAGKLCRAGYVDGVGTHTMFCRPYGITVDRKGDVYVHDTENTSIRKITPEGEVSTYIKWDDTLPTDILVRGGNSQIAVDDEGNLYVPAENRIIKFSPRVNMK